MAATNLVNPPQQFTIPVTKGCDRAFTLNRKNDAGAAVDWDASVYMDILIDPNSPTRITATVTDAAAAFRIESTTCDLVTNSTVWRIVMSQPGSPTLETPVALGKFKRFDG